VLLVSVHIIDQGRYVDEMRLTIASQVIGEKAPSGVKRPNLFDLPDGITFNHKDSPVLNYDKIAVYGSHHIFVRAGINYRHNIGS